MVEATEVFALLVFVAVVGAAAGVVLPDVGEQGAVRELWPEGGRSMSALAALLVRRGVPAAQLASILTDPAVKKSYRRG